MNLVNKSNVANWRRALKHFKKMPEEHFDFGHFLYCPPDQALAWGLDNFGSQGALERSMAATGEVPCGTVACVAGEIFLQFADPKELRKLSSFELDAERFARSFLMLNGDQAHRVFYRQETYKDQHKHSVKISDVVRFFNDQITTYEASK